MFSLFKKNFYINPKIYIEMSDKLLEITGDIKAQPYYNVELPYDFTPSELQELKEGTGDLERLKFLNDRYRHFFYSARNGWGRDKDGKERECTDYYAQALKKKGSQSSQYSKMSRKEKMATLEQAMRVASGGSKLDPSLDFLQLSKGFTSNLLTSDTGKSK